MNIRPTRRGTAVGHLAVLAAVALVGACASAPEYPSTGEGPGTWIVVDNTNTTIGSMTVELIPEYGTRQRLGTVERNQLKEFRIRSTAPTGQFRLRADPVGARALLSHSFSLSEGDRVSWSLNLNSVFFKGSGRDPR